MAMTGARAPQTQGTSSTFSRRAPPDDAALPVPLPGVGAPGQCARCPPPPDPGNPHPVGVQFAWWPDWPELAAGARRIWTAAYGCGWAAASANERSAWTVAFDHQGVLAAWRDRPLIDRPPADAGPRHRLRMRYEIETAVFPCLAPHDDALR